MLLPRLQSTRRIISVGFLLLAAACTPADSERPWLGEVLEVANPGGPGSRYPHLATGPDGTLLMSWLQPRAGGGHELRYTAWEGATWGESRVVTSGTDWFVNWADFPSVVAGADGLRIAHWLQQRPEHVYSYDIRMAVSRDAGRTW
jgi:hypothetical protein